MLSWESAIEQFEKEQLIRKRNIELKNNGEKIKVDLAECEIKSNDYSEEQLLNDDTNSVFSALTSRGNGEALNILTGNDMENVKNVDIYQSVLIFKHSYMNRTETFISAVIPNEHTSLLFKLDIQKTTYIYVDRANRSSYYFDLEFLL